MTACFTWNAPLSSSDPPAWLPLADDREGGPLRVYGNLRAMVAFEPQTVLLGFAMQDFSLNLGMVLWTDPRVCSLASPGPALVPPYETLFWLQPGTFHDRFCASPPLAFGWGGGRCTPPQSLCRRVWPPPEPLTGVARPGHFDWTHLFALPAACLLHRQGGALTLLACGDVEPHPGPSAGFASDDYALDPCWLAHVLLIGGLRTPSVDMFAAPHNALLPCFWTARVDAFSRCWGDFPLVWANPPWGLAPRLLRFLATSRGTCLACLPVWGCLLGGGFLARLCTHAFLLPPVSLFRLRGALPMPCPP